MGNVVEVGKGSRDFLEVDNKVVEKGSMIFVEGRVCYMVANGGLGLHPEF